MAGYRISNLIKLYRAGLKASPALTIIATSSLTVGTIRFVYLLCTCDLINEKPYYRGEYTVVRPDNKVALNWRLPEEYPSPYVSNRSCYDYRDYKKDYGYKADI